MRVEWYIEDFSDPEAVSGSSTNLRFFAAVRSLFVVNVRVVLCGCERGGECGATMADFGCAGWPSWADFGACVWRGLNTKCCKNCLWKTPQKIIKIVYKKLLT